MTSRFSALPLLAFALLSEPLRAIAETAQPPQPNTLPPNYYWPGPWHMWGPGYGYAGWHFWGFPMMFLLMGLICMAFFFLFARMTMGGRGRHWGSTPSWDDDGHSALRVLNERFAKGEIQKAEYEERKAAILK